MIDGKVLLDTNLLIDNSLIIDDYSKVVIPTTVLKELDSLKHKGHKYRTAVKSILNNLDKIELYFNDESITSNDDKLMSAAIKTESVFITKDLCAYLIAKSRGIECILHEDIGSELFEPYCYLNEHDIVPIFTFQQEYDNDDYNTMFNILKEGSKRQDIGKHMWIFFMIQAPATNKITYIYANNPLTNSLVRIDNNQKYKYITAYNNTIKALDEFQHCAFFCLKEAEHTLLTGKWGSGKSVISAAHAIAKSKYTHKKTFIMRPNKGISSEFNIGYRPGNTFDKLFDWCGGFLSSLYFIVSNTRGQSGKNLSYDYTKDELFKKLYEVLPIESIQGVSFMDEDTLLVDEVQLISTDYLSMIISRMGIGSQLILTGDLAQSYSSINSSKSGLRKLLTLMPDKSIAHVDLKYIYRSSVLDIAGRLQNKE